MMWEAFHLEYESVNDCQVLQFSLSAKKGASGCQNDATEEPNHKIQLINCDRSMPSDQFNKSVIIRAATNKYFYD